MMGGYVFTSVCVFTGAPPQQNRGYPWKDGLPPLHPILSPKQDNGTPNPAPPPDKTWGASPLPTGQRVPIPQPLLTLRQEKVALPFWTGQRVPPDRTMDRTSDRIGGYAPFGLAITRAVRLLRLRMGTFLFKLSDSL